MGGNAVRLLGPGDESVVRKLATYEGPGDPEALLADPRTLLLTAFEEERPKAINGAGSHPPCSKRLAELARERGIRTGFVLTEPDNGPANALYRRAGVATDSVKVEWTFSYADD